MAIIKSDLRQLIRLMIDDPQKVLWADADLDLLTEQTMDALWGKIHGYFPYFTSQTDTLTTTSPGFIDLRQTGVGTGQLTNRIHRVQTVTVGSISANALTYERADPRDVVLQGGKVIFAPNYRYVFYGVQLWLFPLDTTANNVELKYSFKPTPAYRTLADNALLGWPDGNEAALWWEVAARALSRGGREDPNMFRTWMGEAWQDMMHSISMQDIGPIVPYAPDAPTSWSGT